MRPAAQPRCALSVLPRGPAERAAGAGGRPGCAHLAAPCHSRRPCLSPQGSRPAAAEAERLARALGARVVRASKHDLNMATGSRPHGGLVLDVGPLEYERLGSWPPAGGAGDEGWSAGTGAPPPLWLCLDEVTDPVRALLSPLCKCVVPAGTGTARDSCVSYFDCT